MSSDTNHPITRITISGATLSSLLNHLNSSSSPTTTGFLFGELSLLTLTTLSDDPPPLQPPPTSLTASISSFSPTPTTTTTRRTLIGSFSARRNSPLRPSLLDHTLLLEHEPEPDTTPFIFLLFATAPQTPHQTLIHTYDYRGYQFTPRSRSFEAVSLEIVNIGPGFRTQYGSFNPRCGLPWLPCVGHVGSPMREDGDKSRSLSEMKREGNDQKELNGYVGEGYEVGSLRGLVGSDSVGYMGGVEGLYESMLGKLQSLARVVEVSGSRVIELENCNAKLRRRVAGIE